MMIFEGKESQDWINVWLPRSSSGTVDFYENSSIILFESTNEKKEEDMNRFLFFNKNYREQENIRYSYNPLEIFDYLYDVWKFVGREKRTWIVVSSLLKQKLQRTNNRSYSKCNLKSEVEAMQRVILYWEKFAMEKMSGVDEQI